MMNREDVSRTGFWAKAVTVPLLPLVMVAFLAAPAQAQGNGNGPNNDTDSSDVGAAGGGGNSDSNNNDISGTEGNQGGAEPPEHSSAGPNPGNAGGPSSGGGGGGPALAGTAGPAITGSVRENEDNNRRVFCIIDDERLVPAIWVDDRWVCPLERLP